MIDHLLLDVFTDRPFTGNPLAVVLDGGELSDAGMHTIANELNLSETVFLGDPDDLGAWPTRIFTPQVELPFAGHPTIGAAIALVESGRVPTSDGLGRCVLAEAVGPVPVEVTRSEDGAATALLTTPRSSEKLGELERGRAAHLLGIDGSALHPDLTPSEWSAGVVFSIVAVRDLDVLGSVRPSAAADHVYAVCPDGAPDAPTWHARMFAPAMGIVEDPATGAAAAALSGLLASLDPTGEPTRRWTIRQGVEMGRPSRIEVVVHRDGARRVTATQIGGSALIVGSGSLMSPDDEKLSG